MVAMIGARGTLLWILVLLSSTTYPVFCNVDREAVRTDEVGGSPEYLREDPQKEKEAPISGFDFYSNEDNGQDWWDEDLGLSFPRDQGKKLNGASNIKVGDSSNFYNSGNVGSNIIYDIVDSIVNAGTFSKSRKYKDSGFQQSRPGRDISVRNMPKHSNVFLDDNGLQIKLPNEAHTAVYIPQKQRNTINSAVNIHISKFGNRGETGSSTELRFKKPTALKSQNLYYPEILMSNPSSVRSENMNAASNIKTGHGAKFFNEGEIGSNVAYIGARTTNSDYERPEMQFSQKQWRTMSSAANLALGPLSTFGNKGKIGSNVEVLRKPPMMRTQKVYYPEKEWNFHPNVRAENLNAATNLKLGHGSKFANEDKIGSNILYFGTRANNSNKKRPKMQFPQKQWRTVNSAANIVLGHESTFGNRGKIGSNLQIMGNPAILRSEKLYYPEFDWTFLPSFRSGNLNAASNIKTGHGAKLFNEGEIGSNIVYIGARTINTDYERPEIQFPQKQWRTMSSAANIALGPLSTFGNKGKIGSNIEVIRKPPMMRTQKVYYPEKLWNSDPIFRSENLNAATNLKLGYGSKFANEGKIGSNTVYVGTRENNAKKKGLGIQFPQKQWGTMNSAANIELGGDSTFANRGNIGSNIQIMGNPEVLRSEKLNYTEFDWTFPPSFRSENLNAASNVKTGHGAKFFNEGEIGSNVAYIGARTTNTDYVRPEIQFPQKQWRAMSSAANLDLGPLSTFGNKGKIGSNIEVIRKPPMMQTQKVYYPEELWNFHPIFRSENLNAATNLKLGYGAKFANEGKIGSNTVYFGTRANNTNQERPQMQFPQKQRRTMHSAANLAVGPLSTLRNKGKIGSNIEVIRKPPMMRTQKMYYPEEEWNFHPNFRSENLNAAINFKLGYGSKFANEGKIGSNIVYFGTRGNNAIEERPEMPFPQKKWRTMYSAANVDLGRESTFGNRGKIGSNLQIMRNPAVLRSEKIYYPEFDWTFLPSLRSDNLNAASNIKTDHGAKLFNEGEIGSNIVYIGERTTNADYERPEIQFPQKQWRTMYSAANLALGPLSTFGNTGKISSNIYATKKPENLRSQVLYYPDVLLRYPQRLRSESMNAAEKSNTGYGTTFNHEGEIGSNLIYNGVRTTMRNQKNTKVYFPCERLRKINSAANVDLSPLFTPANSDKCGSGIEIIKKPTVLRSQNLFHPEILMSNLPSLRSENMNAAANIKTGYGNKAFNEGEIGSNLLYNVERRTKARIPRNHSRKRLQHLHKRRVNSRINLNLGRLSAFGNKGKIGSNMIQNRQLYMSKVQNQYHPEAELRYLQSLRSDNLNAATNLNTAYGAKFTNKGEIGSNVLHTWARSKSANNVQTNPHLMQQQWKTMSSKANLDLGAFTKFENTGKIGSNINVRKKPGALRSQKIHYRKILSSFPSGENLSAAGNLKIGYGASFGNEGEMGSNLIHNEAMESNNKMRSGFDFSQTQRRTMHSAANIEMDGDSTFGNKGNIGSNIQIMGKPEVLRSKKIYYPQFDWIFPPSFRSENLNAASNIKTGHGAKIFNEGEIGSNIVYIGENTKNTDYERPEMQFPQKQWKTMSSAANIALGPLSTFGNKGKIGSNIEVIRKPPIMRTQKLYYPEKWWNFQPIFRSENLNAATNLKLGYGSKFANEGKIGSNILYFGTRGNSTNKERPQMQLPQKQWRTMSSAANIALGPLSTFGNKGKVGSNIEVIRKPPIMRTQKLYYPEKMWNFHPIFRSENLNAATNLKLGYGSKFANEGKIGSNALYFGTRENNKNKERPEMQFPQKQLKTMYSAANLALGPMSTFGNTGKIGSNIDKTRKPENLRSQLLHYPDMLLSYPQRLQSESMYAAANLNSGYGAMFNNEGEIGSNLIYNGARATNREKRNAGLYASREKMSKMNSAVNPDLFRGSTFGNRGSIGSNLQIVGKPGTLRSEELYYPGIDWKFHPNFRSGYLNAASNLNTDYGAKFFNEGEIGSNIVHIEARTTNRDFERPEVQFPQKQWRTMYAAANLALSPLSTFVKKGKIGYIIDPPRKPVRLRSEKLYGLEMDLIYPLSFQSENTNTANETSSQWSSYPRIFLKPSLEQEDSNRIKFSSDLKFESEKLIRGDTCGKLSQRLASNLKNQLSSRNIHRLQSGMHSPNTYDIWVLRTAEKDAKKKISKGKDIVNIFMESGSLFENKGAVGSERYELHTSPSKIKLRGNKPTITSYAYVIPPSGKGRSAMSGGKVVTGISTKIFRQQPDFEIGDKKRNLKHIFHERSSLINDGAISASEILLSRGSAITSNRSKTQLSKFPPAAFSFGKLGLDMAHSSNKASIIAGDNAQIIINGKMGTYQVSIPIGSIVASEGSDVSLRTSDPYSESDLFSESSVLDLKSSLKFLKNHISIMTGVVKITSIDPFGYDKLHACELENPITAVEVGRPLFSNKLLLRLLFVTKLRINLANFLSYLTAISKEKLDERLYASLKILYNAIQYRQINVLPLMLLNQNINMIPPEMHFRAMLELLYEVSPLNVKDFIETLIKDIEKQEAKYKSVSENLTPLIMDTLALDMIPGIITQLKKNVLFGDMNTFINEVVYKAFFEMKNVASVRELKDIMYLTMLNLPLSYSVPQLPVKLRLVAQMLYMELTDQVWTCAYMRAQHMPIENVYIDLKHFFKLLLECPNVSENIRTIVHDTVQILPNAVPNNNIFELSITSFGPTVAKVIMRDIIENGQLDAPVHVTNSLGNAMFERY